MSDFPGCVSTSRGACRSGKRHPHDVERTGGWRNNPEPDMKRSENRGATAPAAAAGQAAA
ncbi:hypothetical protein [Burkholderia sp. Bp8991]|uniref:hypothetical protein n=1 Tax=Burkholderia sp. Bp8991 TaxID=2184553 RepID=UPI000F5B46C3|nr:hypothetical protein [Burkholderia sp. Bp8991]